MWDEPNLSHFAATAVPKEEQQISQDEIALNWHRFVQPQSAIVAGFLDELRDNEGKVPS